MAIKIVRKQRKNANGTYDIIHPETQAKAVWMSDGRSVEEVLPTKVSELTNDSGFVTSDHSHSTSESWLANALASAGAKIATGSYTGTGSTGSSSPCLLTMNFEPKFVFLVAGNDTTNSFDGRSMWLAKDMAFYPQIIQKSTTSYPELLDPTSASQEFVVTWGANFVQWYAGRSAIYQFNVSNVTYRWLAIG